MMSPEVIDALIKYHEERYKTFWVFAESEIRSREKLTIYALKELKKYETTAHPTAQRAGGVTE